MNLSELEKQLNQQMLPPVHLWKPEFCGDIDIRIDREGHWFHEGRKIARDGLVKLFSSVLIKEGNDYFLITPVEKMRIRVDAEPFVLVDAEPVDDAWVFTERLGQQVVMDPQHPLQYRENEQGEPYPTLVYRANLSALIHRNLFYFLVEQAKIQPMPDGSSCWYLTSKGQDFLLAKA